MQIVSTQLLRYREYGMVALEVVLAEQGGEPLVVPVQAQLPAVIQGREREKEGERESDQINSRN